MKITILYNEPSLPTDHPDYLSEAGVLESVSAFEAILAGAGHHVTRLGARASAADLVTALTVARPDVVVNLCEGFAGRPAGEPHVAGLLELLGLAYTGCGCECTALARDKARTKWLLLGAGLPTAEFHLVSPGGPLPRDQLERALADGPLFVKPAAEDASLGIGRQSVVTDWNSLVAQVESVGTNYGHVLIERYIAGREFNVGVIALPEPQVLPIAEVQFTTGPDLPWPILTYESKWHEGSVADRTTPVTCPAHIESSLQQQIQSIALAAYQATGCRDYARVDLRVTPAGEVLVLEINANPDAGPAAGLARAIRASGIAYEDFVLRLVETASSRRKTQSAAGQGSIASIELPAPSRTGDVRLRTLQDSDRPALLDLLQACGMFRPDEIQVAAEILQEAVAAGPAGHYSVLVAEQDGRSVGWSCHGLVPLTDATYDLYWIAVHPDCQSQGVGRQLLKAIEEELRRAGGRWLIAETSSTALYDKTRSFYLRNGYEIVGDVPDFYRSGDGRVTFGKRLN